MNVVGMIKKDEISDIVESYQEITIGIFGSHSAKDLGMAAKACGFSTAIVVEEGRDTFYTVRNRHLYDTVIRVKTFKDMLREDVQDRLRELNTIFIP
ncbi:MAG: DUF1246 domain-containing protein, partial [Candidatus Hydrothermarchaeaceae archaeon]